MPNPGTNAETSHRLCAILFADMVGYSSLPQTEALSHKEQMLTFARECLRGHTGRLVKTLGDGFLAEFQAATDAVGFAIELQERVAQHNASVAARQRFRLRIGIHAGEVVVRGDDVEGSTVNVAARTEPLAAPGGICLTEPVWRQVQETLPRAADRLGRLRVKGIGRQFCFYHLAPERTGLAARCWLRARLFFNWPGRLPASIVAVGVLLALGVWLRPFGGEILDHFFPPTATRLVERAKQGLERYDRPNAVGKAIKDLREALRLEPSFTEAQAALSLAYWRRYQVTKDQGDRFEAWSQSSNVVARFADSHLARFVQGVVAKNEGRLHDATNHLARANIAAEWEDGEVLLELAFACQGLNEPSNAVYYAQKAELVQRKPWYFFNTLARYRLSLDDLVGAQTNLEAALVIADDNPTVWLNLGQILELELPATRTNLAAQLQAKRALACLNRSLKLKPTASAYEGVGLHYLKETNWLAAATNYLTAAWLNPARYELIGKAGLTLTHVPGREAEGRQLLASAVDKVKAVKENTWQPVDAANLGLYQAALGQGDEASRTFRKAWDERANDSRVRYLMLEAIERLTNQGQTNAAQQLKHMLDPAPENSHTSGK